MLRETKKILKEISLIFFILNLMALPVFTAEKASEECGYEARKEYIELVKKGVDIKEIRQHFAHCIEKSKELALTEDDGVEVHQNDGDTSFEKLIAIGYDPQKQKFAGIVKIKDSEIYDDYEHVLICIKIEGVWKPMRRGAVHIKDESTGLVSPPWYFGVIDGDTFTEQELQWNDFRNSILQDPSVFSGRTFLIRAILSFAVQPASCSFAPAFGNVVEKAIRLDP